MRPSDDELPRRVHQVVDVEAEEVEHLLRVNLLLDARYEDVDDIVLDAAEHGFVSVELVVLRRNDDGVDALRNAFVGVFHRHLALGVGAQIRHLLAFVADVGQRPHDEVGQIEAHGHQVLRLVHRIAEHHALVAGSLCVLVVAVHAAVDVRTLLVNARQDAAGVAVELIFGLRVSDAFDRAARYGLQVDVGFRAHLAHDDHLSGGDEALDGAARLRVVGQELV